MKRRVFISVLGAATWPGRARAQRPGKPVIGFLSVGLASDRGREHLIAAVHQGLSERGFSVGRNVEIEFRWAGADFDRLPDLAGELVGRQVAVIFAGADFAARAAKAKTADIPIVFAIGSDPIQWGLVDSLNRPGGNATGTTWISTELQVKRLELLHELVPSARIAILSNANSVDSETATKMLQTAARGIGLEVIAIQTRHDGDLDAAIERVANSGAGALLIANDSFFNIRRHRIVALVAHHRMPTMYDLRASVEAGGLSSYGASQLDAVRQAGVYVGRVLKGEKPAELPVQTPTRFQFVLNLKTAKALGLTIPPSVLERADEVIE